MGEVNDLIVSSIQDLKQSIKDLGVSLNARIDSIDDKLNKLDKEYSQRIVSLEESNKSSITNKILLSLVFALVGYIINHLVG